MINQLIELEILISPEMNVYKNIIESGFEKFLFKNDFLKLLVVLEEFLHIMLLGSDSYVPGEKDKIESDVVSTNDVT